MIVKVTLGSWRFTWSMAPVTNVVGVNSRLDSGDHILMWDFDALRLSTVRNELERIQRIYQLPDIYITETSPDTGYHAWCFKRVKWRKLVEILAFTKGLDWNYFKYGIYRKEFTLRVGPKCGRKIKHVITLHSKVKEDVTVHDLKKWVRYETLADGRKSRKMEVKVP